MVDDFAKVIPAGDLVSDLPKNLPDLVFDSVRTAGLLREAVQVREELRAYEVAEVVAGQGFVVVEFAVLALGCSPAFPSVGRIENVGVFLAFERGLGALVLLTIK